MAFEVFSTHSMTSLSLSGSPAYILRSSMYNKCEIVLLSPSCQSVYPLVLLRAWDMGAMARQKRSGDKESPWKSPLLYLTGVLLTTFPAVLNSSTVAQCLEKSSIDLLIQPGYLMVFSTFITHLSLTLSYAF